MLGRLRSLYETGREELVALVIREVSTMIIEYIVNSEPEEKSCKVFKGERLMDNYEDELFSGIIDRLQNENSLLKKEIENLRMQLETERFY